MENRKSQFSIYKENLEEDGYVFGREDFEVFSEYNQLMHQIHLARYCLIMLGRRNFESEDDVLDGFKYTSLLIAFLASYGKCFADAAGGKPTLDHKVVFKGKPEALKAHERVTHLRNSYAGHNGMSGITTCMIGVKENQNNIEIENIVKLDLEEEDMELFELAAAEVELAIMARFRKHMDKLSQKLGKPIIFDL